MLMKLKIYTLSLLGDKSRAKLREIVTKKIKNKIYYVPGPGD